MKRESAEDRLQDLCKPTTEWGRARRRVSSKPFWARAFFASPIAVGRTEQFGRGAGVSKAVLLFCGVVLLLLSGCGRSEPGGMGDSGEQGSATGEARAPLSAESIARIERFCGDCHGLPSPSAFPRDHWDEEVRQGFAFYMESQRTDLEEPLLMDVVRYYQEAAPEEVEVPRADALPSGPAPVRFERTTPAAPLSDAPPATSHVVWNASRGTLLTADMRAGELREWTPAAGKDWSSRRLAAGQNVCRVTPCDWSGDGGQDYLIGELGSFGVEDHDRGRVTLLLADEQGGHRRVPLAEGMARVVEAQPFDYDEDGDLDVLVAEFGWRNTGMMKLLRNVGGTPQAPQMEVEVIDPRHGALGVQVVDLDCDGRLDFVVAYGQEYETVEAYFNRGAGKFEKEVLLQLAGPSYNSSSFQVVDLDQDGLPDVVHTNGDTLDAFLPKPYHGVRWVRNLGDGNWETRELGLLVGALQACVADFDGDGDLDVAAVGLFPVAHEYGPGAYDSIVWWEQRAGLEFVRHSIERDHCMHATCTATDVDGDGRPDLVVGEWSEGSPGPAFSVFVNRPASAEIARDAAK